MLGWFTEDVDCFVDLDILSGNDWNAFIQIKAILKFFDSVTEHLEINTVNGIYGDLWKVIINLECLVDALQQVQVELRNDISTYHLNICVMLAIRKLEEYLSKINHLVI